MIKRKKERETERERNEEKKKEEEKINQEERKCDFNERVLNPGCLLVTVTSSAVS